MNDVVLVWLRQDLRLHDQPAFLAAAEDGCAVVPVYVLDDDTPGDWRIGGAQRWWLHHSLAALAKDLEALGSRLVIRRGPAAAEIAKLAKELGAKRVHAIRHYEPWWIAAEQELASAIDLVLHDGNQLAPPETVRSGSGEAFKIFSPFWRALEAKMPPEKPKPAPGRLTAPDKWPPSTPIAALSLLPTKPDWSGGFAEEWAPGEAGAADRLKAFQDAVGSYDDRRNLPSDEGTSRLSPHLHWGEVSPATVWHAVARKKNSEGFKRELGWRDFTSAVEQANPEIGDQNARAAFDKLKWRTGKAADSDFRKWTKGQTGYPIVDAGMRQLWTSGWMHNRARMITASFLIKHLLIDWRRGERWFWDTLVDADYGNNSVNWQWVAGTGHDANMFSRIMAPLTQSAKFEAAEYIRRWVPELASLDDEVIHDPEAAGVTVKGYPAKLIGHREGRERALAAGRAIRG
ncbi:deoxyribodipyrimidine photo-lyase [Sphingomonas jejuensis]|uniref:Deoxyribodipyrimidine photo-lyase n=1 Tax=Sphingomonas jejuensis TaxID=904715 RepID=A0ABX0XLA1_9SPHN|nr:deoxyribodipyrimidine photo-lyase [Sphingomonas jejuensis]NJC33609.1 deoxyribodipyrimidine photo-lyase [Sphingomonas jejuensis]